ncbi:hypothetical protein [Pseudarthrobacter sp. N5]|uniref:hypothetical protein n=1 Tax=Pseudarthrobacter sp. N5 TaxID=3418416 RepID=UPI003CF43501
MLSADGRDFQEESISHDALEGQDLDFSAMGITDRKLMIAGHTGPLQRRKAFSLALDVPQP